MKKLKVLIASMIGVIAFAFACVVGTTIVKAESSILYTTTAASETENKEYAKATDIASVSNVISFQCTGAKSKVMAYSVSEDYPLGLWHSNNTNSSKKYFIFYNKTSSNKVRVDVKIGASRSLDSVETITESEIAFGSDSNTVTTATGDVTTISYTINAGSDAKMYSTAGNARVIIYEVAYEVLSESSDYTANYDLGGGTGTAPSNQTVSKTGDEAARTITLPTTTATKTGYTFAGWNNGDSTDENNPYAAGSSYTLTKDVTFTAVWELNLTLISDDLYYEFTSATGNGTTIIVQNGQLYDNSALKMQSATAINFKTANEMRIILTFTNNASAGVKIDGTSKTIDSTTLTYEADLSAGTHVITRGSNENRLASIRLVSKTVTPLVQKAVDTENGYTYVRFVTIIKGVEEIDATDVTFSVTMDYADTSKADKTNAYTPYVVKKITQNGETYTAEVDTVSHSFDNSVNPTEYYVVYVLRLTTSKFSGNSIYATTTFNGDSYDSSSVTI